MTETKPTILITGGHLTPALALLEQLQDKPVTSVFVGRDHANKSGTVAKEAEEVSALGISFKSFNPPKLYRYHWWQNLAQIPLIYSSFREASRLLSELKPAIVVSFGGYLALPIALAAKLKGIPVVIHEQTSVMGLTNRLVAPLAKAIYISWLETKRAPGRAKVIGNPIRQQLTKKATKPNWYPSTTKPLIYVTGGNQGAVAINEAIEPLLEQLTSKYVLVHQSGQVSYSQLDQVRSKLDAKQKDSYILKPWFSATEVSWLLVHAALVISRSGANTVTELLYHQTPSLLIPLPISAEGEQQANAQILVKLGLAKVVAQDNLSTLAKEIDTFFGSSNFYQPQQKLIEDFNQRNKDAAATLADEVVKCVAG